MGKVYKPTTNFATWQKTKAKADAKWQKIKAKADAKAPTCRKPKQSKAEQYAEAAEAAAALPKGLQQVFIYHVKGIPIKAKRRKKKNLEPSRPMAVTSSSQALMLTSLLLTRRNPT